MDYFSFLYSYLIKNKKKKKGKKEGKIKLVFFFQLFCFVIRTKA